MRTPQRARAATYELIDTPELPIREVAWILLVTLLVAVYPSRATSTKALYPKAAITDTLIDSLEALEADAQLPLEIPATAQVPSAASDSDFDWKSADLRNRIEITQQDVARGFIEVPFASRLTVRAKDRSDFHVVVSVRANWIQGAEIRGIGRSIRIGPRGGTYREMVPTSGQRTFHFSYRIDLTQDAAPGTFPWPITVAARDFASSIAAALPTTVRTGLPKPSRLNEMDLQRQVRALRNLSPAARPNPGLVTNRSRQESDLPSRTVRASSH